MWKAVGAVVGVGIVGFGVWWFIGGGSESMMGSRLMDGATATDPNSLEQADGHANGESQTGSWNDLLGMSAAVQCTAGTKTNGVESVGTVYVANGNMRGDFSSTVNGRTVDSHMIATADTVYTWSSGMPQGVKMPKPTSTGATGSSQGFDPNAEVNYSCRSWTADASKFNPPSDIKFMDISAMMGGSMQVQ